LRSPPPYITLLGRTCNFFVVSQANGKSWLMVGKRLCHPRDAEQNGLALRLELFQLGISNHRREIRIVNNGAMIGRHIHVT